MTARSLRRLQQWFAGVVEHRGTAADALHSGPLARIVPPAKVDAVIAANPRLDAAGMLDIYNGGYLARLVEVLEGDYAAVRQLLGEAGFRDLVAAYLAAYPSRHPNLNRLGRHFPAFVRTRRRLPKRAFVTELAELELALCLAFDAPEFTAMTPAAIAAVPPARWDRARLCANPSLQLLTFRFPVDRCYQNWKDGGELVVPAAERSWLVVHRREDRVWRQRLSRVQFGVLQRLCRGAPLAEALAVARAGEPVGDWFAGFARDGLFTGLGRSRHSAPTEPSRRA